MGALEVQQADKNETLPQHKMTKAGFFDATPEEQIEQATNIANVLSRVIDKQGLFSNIQGKKYVKAEGWTLLGTFLGIVPREKSVIRHPDGSYEAYVEIVKFRDGAVVGGGSAICSRSERRWEKADEYAVRSMAVTRATSKSFRTGFSWIVTLAGYSPTPEEEIPQAITVEVVPEKATKKPYDAHDESQQAALIEVLKGQKIDASAWATISDRLQGKFSKDLPGIIKSVMKELSHEQEVVAVN